MLRPFLLLAIFLSAMSAARSQLSTPPPQALEPEIRLPSISHRWAVPADKDAPEITMDEMERCMGLDVDLQRRFAVVRQREQQLETEKSELEKANDQLKKNAADLTATKAQLTERNDRHGAMSIDLKQQLDAIDKRKRAKLTKQSEVDAINALVSGHNADVGRYNRFRVQLLEDRKVFSAAVDQYNAEAGTLNGRVAVFKQRVDAYQILASDFRQASQQHVSACTGQRVIRKPEAAGGS